MNGLTDQKQGPLRTLISAASQRLVSSSQLNSSQLSSQRSKNQPAFCTKTPNTNARLMSGAGAAICVICYDAIHTPAVIYPCKHSVFHYGCILSWLAPPPHHVPADRTCPLCRCVPALVRRGRRRFAVPAGTTYARLLGETRTRLLRSGSRLWGGERIAATAWMLVQLSALQQRHDAARADEIAAVAELSPRLAEAQERMLAAVVALHARVCDGGPTAAPRGVLRALRKVRSQARVLEAVWEDVRWDEDCRPPVRWRLDVVTKLVPGPW